MKILLDVCVSSRALSAYLAAQGHDVSSVMSVDPSATDEQVLSLALNDDRVLITADNDFGELIFALGRPHGPIIRTVELTVDEQIQAISELLRDHTDDLSGPVIVTITPGRIRIRRQDA
jgi:predicted nuclease of predicted toxin-antitoxin system